MFLVIYFVTIMVIINAIFVLRVTANQKHPWRSHFQCWLKFETIIKTLEFTEENVQLNIPNYSFCQVKKKQTQLQ